MSFSKDIVEDALSPAGDHAAFATNSVGSELRRTTSNQSTLAVTTALKTAFPSVLIAMRKSNTTTITTREDASSRRENSGNIGTTGTAWSAS